jgi:class 3 adenylate cyclase
MEPRIQYCKTRDGVNIAYATLGKGPPVVYPTVLWGDIAFYQSGVRHYAPAAVDYLVESGRSVTLYDGRGTGLSDREPAAFSAEARLSDLEAVIDALGGGPFDLVGRVQGTSAAIAYTVKYPDRVRHLILWNPFARGSDYYAATAFTRAVRAFATAAIDDWAFVTLTVANWALNFSDLDEARTLAAIFREGMEYETYLKALEDSFASDVSELLPQVPVPTLIMRDTSRAFAAAPHLAKPLASRIPGAQFVTVDGMRATASAIVEFTSDAVSEPSVPEGAPRSGLVTILFTDLTSSTALTQRLGDAKAQELVRAHNTIVRDALAAQGGTEIKHTGDGIMASFPSASGALECAVAIQRGVLKWGERAHGHAPLQVHIGLNAGEPVADEGDLFGTAVQLARRICDQASGGEILASDVVRQLSAGKGFLFADRGDVVPKGFDEAVRLYEVRWREEKS